MSKSIKIIDKIVEYLFLSSKFRNEPLFSNLDKLPQKLRSEMKDVRSEELMNIRKDCL